MTFMPVELFLALRYLKPKRTFVSMITLISIVGVMLGVAVLIIVISVMTGFDRQLRDRILGFNSHLKVFDARAPMTNYVDVAHRIRATPGVRGVAPFVMGQVMVKTQPMVGSPRVLAPVVRGIDPDQERHVSILPESILQGDFDVDRNGVLIGTALAEKMDLRVGDTVAVYSIRNLEEMERNYRQGEETAILPDDYEIRGIFDVGYYEYNELFLVCSLRAAQDIYGLGRSVHGLMVTLDDPDRAAEIRNRLQPELGPGILISTWMEENSGILDALVVEKNVMFYLLFFIMIVAAFGITSGLITFAVQKTREIGMLKALGASESQIVFLFLSQSFIVGVIGVVSGFVLGYLAVLYRNDFLTLMRRLTGFELFPDQIYNFTQLPALIVVGDLAVICGGSMVICVLAGALPAWTAGRLRPAEALRHE